jgi:hypothetical protein
LEMALSVTSASSSLSPPQPLVVELGGVTVVGQWHWRRVRWQERDTVGTPEKIRRKSKPMRCTTSRASVLCVMREYGMVHEWRKDGES